MIYVVTGLPRSGTTIMMRCLNTGGIAVPEETSEEKMELPSPTIDQGIGAEYDKKLVKIFSNRLGLLDDGEEYTAVFMMRHPENIITSFWNKFPFGYPGIDFPKDAKIVEQLQNQSVRAWGDRSNVHLDFVYMEYLQKEPKDVFIYLANTGEWPIDPSEACLPIDVQEYERLPIH